MAKKILLILIGGTICTKVRRVEEELIRLNSEEAGLRLVENFKNSYSAFASSVEIEATENYGILSEDMTVSKWNELLSRFRGEEKLIHTAKARGSYPSLDRKFKESEVYDGILIAHGTDSLAYSAALFSLLFKRMGVPVFLVSSNEPLSSDRANGNANFKAAIECICLGIKPDVYVTYQNLDDAKMYLHLASRLRQCGNYQEDFHSFGEVDITELCEANARRLFEKLPTSHEEVACGEADGFCIDPFGDWRLEGSVLRIEPYVGLRYDVFDLSGVRAILHGTYHSGTVCVEKSGEGGDYQSSSVLSLIDRCETTDLYFAPSRLDGEIYDTLSIAARHNSGVRNVRFVYGYTMEMLYVKLLVAYSLHFPDVDAFLEKEYNKEFVFEITGIPKIVFRYEKSEKRGKNDKEAV